MHLSDVSQMALGLASRQVLQMLVGDSHCNPALLTSLATVGLAVAQMNVEVTEDVLSTKSSWIIGDTARLVISQNL